jgi:integrase
MPKIALTDAAVKRLKAPEAGQVDYFDKGYPGLCLRLGARKRTWYWIGRVGDRLKRHRLGAYPDKGLAEARELWRKAREMAGAGKPPRPPPQHRDAVEAVVAEWLKRDQAGNATHAEVKAVFDGVIVPEWSGRLITSVDRRDVLELLDAVADRGRIGRARKLHAWLNRLFAWCVGRGILEGSPMAKLPKHGEAVVRDRVLSDAEVRALWRATGEIGHPYGTLVRVLALTLAREAEIARLTWDELDDGGRFHPAAGAEIRLAGARTKNGQARTIPITPPAWAIVAAAPRILGCPYVFPSRGLTPIAGWSKLKARLDGKMGVNEPWRLHDLRRTGATALERIGVPLPVTEAILGHTSGSKAGIVAVYQQHDYGPEKRAALAKWGAHVLGIVG